MNERMSEKMNANMNGWIMNEQKSGRIMQMKKIQTFSVTDQLKTHLDKMVWRITAKCVDLSIDNRNDFGHGQF